MLAALVRRGWGLRGTRIARLAIAECADDALAFRDGVDAVDGRQLDGLFRAGWPVNLRCSCARSIAQAKVQAAVIGGDVALARKHVAALAHAIRGQVNGGAGCVARTLRAAF